jgi:hypothetical protein
MFNITIDKEVTFDLPSGVHKATLTNVKPFYKQAAKGKQDWIRLLFEVDIQGMENLDCRAGRNFMLSFKAGSDLRNFLSPLLGSDFFKQNSARTIDLEKLLIGRTGMVELSHFIGEQYDKPLVVVEKFAPVNLGGKD